VVESSWPSPSNLGSWLEKEGGTVHKDITIFGEGTLTFQEFAMASPYHWQASIKQCWSICVAGKTLSCSGRTP
jgi:hypothetical protein